MIFKYLKKEKWLFFWAVCLLPVACSKETNPISPIPDVQVREQVNLNALEALPLKTRDGNFIYISGGIQGIIVYRRTQDNFVAFERQSPYNMANPCSRVSVHSSKLYLIDSCNQCTFDWEGRPTGGPNRSTLKNYRLEYLNNFTLLITNP